MTRESCQVNYIKYHTGASLDNFNRVFQSDREKSEGLPVAPFMDRDKVTKATAQIGFLKFVLIPMFETVTKVSYPRPETEVRICRTSVFAPTGVKLARGKGMYGSHSAFQTISSMYRLTNTKENVDILPLVFT